MALKVFVPFKPKGDGIETIEDLRGFLTRELDDILLALP
jgi:hypothetical protein